MNKLEIKKNEPVSEQPNLFGPPTPVYDSPWRRQGDRLRDHRLLLGLTLMRSAEILGLEPRTLAELEQGAYEFDFFVAKELLRRGS